MVRERRGISRRFKSAHIYLTLTGNTAGDPEPVRVEVKIPSCCLVTMHRDKHEV